MISVGGLTNSAPVLDIGLDIDAGRPGMASPGASDPGAG